MRPAAWALLLLACAAASAAAQQAPVVTVTRILKEARPHLAAQRVGVGNCYGVASAASTELIATIKVTLPGPYERTAEHLAKEKAGELGANCLLPEGAAGEDSARYPVQRAYKALRVLVPFGAYQVPASPGDFPAPPAAPTGSFQAPGPKEFRPPPEHQAHLGWTTGKAALEHTVIIDPATAGPEVWAEIVKDAQEYFPPEDYARLQRAAAKGVPVRLDFVNFTISEADAAALKKRKRL